MLVVTVETYKHVLLDDDVIDSRKECNMVIIVTYYSSTLPFALKNLLNINFSLARANHKTITTIGSTHHNEGLFIQSNDSLWSGYGISTALWE